jgi:hypothetical protein
MVRWLTLHRWLALAAGLPLLLAAGTAIALNHQNLLAPAPPPATVTTTPFGDYMLCLYSGVDQTLVGTAKGLYVTQDGGHHWQRVQTASPVEQVIALAGTPSGLYLATRTGQVQRSRDQGHTWTSLPTPCTEPLHGLAVHGDDVDVLAASGLYRWQAGAWHAVLSVSAAPEAPGRALLRLVYNLHDGTFWGRFGVWVTDLTAIAMVLLMTTGYVAWYLRWRSRRASKPA